MQAAFLHHDKETAKQVQRLDEVFDLIGKRAAGKKCPGIDGIIAEANDGSSRDAGMLAAA